VTNQQQVASRNEWIRERLPQPVIGLMLQIRPPTARIIRDVAELRTLKGQAGKNMYVVGATLVASLLNEDLIEYDKR
jgi:hypothetical protein